jgi:hypothetical protein
MTPRALEVLGGILVAVVGLVLVTYAGLVWLTWRDRIACAKAGHPGMANGVCWRCGYREEK